MCLSNEATTRDILKYFLSQILRFMSNHEKKIMKITTFIEIFLKSLNVGSKSKYHTLVFIRKNNLLKFTNEGTTKEHIVDTKL